jgi:predicted RNA binding protein YcfA (HicA-like mRNA interferase family)
LHTYPDLKEIEMEKIFAVDHLRAVSALEDAGFWILRQGGHVVMTDGKRIVTIPCQDPVYASTLDGIVRDAGLSPDQFRELL